MLSEPILPEARIVPLAYAGQWIAWNRQGTRVVASAGTLEEAKQAANSAGEMEPVFAKVPKADGHLRTLEIDVTPAFPGQIL
jgi:hypothetical protein